MATRLKNILTFTVTPGGGSVSLPHGLTVQNGRPVEPDFVIPSLPGFDISADDTNVTVSGDGTVDVLVESWHTIERVFGDVATRALTPQPFIVGGGTSPTPPFAIGTIVIYARMTGNDTSGKGTLAKPYRTLQRAVRDVPNIIPPGVAYIVDITGVGGVVFDELLPPDYILPVWKAPKDGGEEVGDPIFRITRSAVSIQATPQLVASIPAVDAVINVGDVLSTSQDPLTQFWTITLNVARPSWGTSSPGVVGSGLKGKFAVGPDTIARAHPTVGQNTTSTILLTSAVAPTYPIKLMEPSAHLHAAGSFITFATISADNCDSIAFNGIKITSDDGNGGLFAGGTGSLTIQLCELESPFIQSINDYQVKVLSNWFYGFPGFQCSAFQCLSGIFDNTNSGPFFVFGPPATQPSFGSSLFDNADPITYNTFIPFNFPVKPTSTPQFGVVQCLIRGSTGPGISWHGGNGFIQDCDIYGCAGSAIEATLGHGVIQVINCGSSGGANGAAGDAAVFVDDGAFVKVDASTVTNLTPLQGGAVGQDMQVGVLPFRTWANFNANAPIQNEYDLVGMNAGATDQSTGSRLYE